MSVAENAYSNHVFYKQYYTLCFKGFHRLRIDKVQQ